jgi:LysR family transcriptional regulator, glycine cleavage system transcriptional activator
MSNLTRFATLNSLRAFEAAGRHASFSIAAEELNVTPGAISRHIRSLELALGTELFIRGHRSVEMAPEGLEFHRSLTEGFTTIEASARQFRDKANARPVIIACPELLATKWLAPRLSAFRRRYPNHDVEISPFDAELDTPAASRSAEILVTLGNSGDTVDTVQLFRSELVVVCSPRLKGGAATPLRPADILAGKLLTSPLQVSDWSSWLSHAGLDIDDAEILEYESPAAAYEAACLGRGYGLVERSYVADDLHHGSLVTALPVALSRSDVSAIASTRSGSMRRAVREVMSWLNSIAATEPPIEITPENHPIRRLSASSTTV